jgi:hypothetical protein
MKNEPLVRQKHIKKKKIFYVGKEISSSAPGWPDDLSRVPS